MNPTTEAVYLYICQYLQKNGQPPTQREIADACYLSQSSVRYHLKKLVAAGWVQPYPKKARALTVNLR